MLLDMGKMPDIQLQIMHITSRAVTDSSLSRGSIQFSGYFDHIYSQYSYLRRATMAYQRLALHTSLDEQYSVPIRYSADIRHNCGAELYADDHHDGRHD